MSYFKHHLFFCCNQREPGEACCANHRAEKMRDYAKQRVKKLLPRADGAPRVRVNIAGCLDRCELGPVLVIYPEGVWYTYRNKDDIDEIIASHLLEGKIVKRLKLSDKN